MIGIYNHTEKGQQGIDMITPEFLGERLLIREGILDNHRVGVVVGYAKGPVEETIGEHGFPCTKIETVPKEEIRTEISAFLSSNYGLERVTFW